MKFYLGTHRVPWLTQARFRGIPLFVSRRRLMVYKSLPFADRGVTWALDSGAFKEIEQFGGWTWTARKYALWVRTVEYMVGGMEWAACMDWMCEPHMLKRTGLSIGEHQRRTVANYTELVSLAPDVPWVPALQGWEPDDYVRCAEMYEKAGVSLSSLPLVGLGSVCRRQHTPQIVAVVGALAGLGIRLHGFGVKTRGLQVLKQGSFATADSMAWSFGARKQWHSRKWKMNGCTHSGSCANCARYAMHWRRKLIASLATLCLCVGERRLMCAAQMESAGTGGD